MRTKHSTRLWPVALLLAALAASDTTVPPARADGCVPGTGGLIVYTDGQPTEHAFPLKHTDVAIDVTGFVSRVVVTQTFQNPFTDTIEAVYVFPLPHEAAVTDLTMQVGDRTIVGEIERRETARAIYENARDAGYVAALLEQERANIFTQSVANILPGNEIEVKITYVGALEYEKGEYELVFPMVVGPRFVPPASRPTGDALAPAGGLAPIPIPSIPDADRITPPYLPPSVRSGHDVSVRVNLDAGIAVRDVRSPTHSVRVDRDGSRRATVRLSDLDDIPNKDFVLRYRVDGDGPETAVLSYHDAEDGYVSVVVQPKIDLTPGEITPKEMVFVLDCSGSMSGEPIAAAKSLVRHALRDMRPEDSFQIIRFSSNASGLATAPIACTPDNVRRGIAYLDGLNGGGGTMMIEGVKAALDFPTDPSRLRIVMFLTDGYIGNDDEILAAVRDRIGGARLFSFGVGSSVNRYLLDRLAEEGRGEVAYYLPGSDVNGEVERFYGRVRNPYLTDIQLAWNGVRVDDVLPARIPDLFEGKPLVVNARYAKGGRGELVIRGRLAGRPWTRTVKVDLPTRESGNPAVGALWARARIVDLERASLRGETFEIVEEITRIGLAHRLVTKHTSFVAVEETMRVSNGVPTKVRVPLEMPAGVSFEGALGEREERAVQKYLSASPPAPGSSGSGVPERLRALGYIGGADAGRDVRSSAPLVRSESVRRDVPRENVVDEGRVERDALGIRHPKAVASALTVAVQAAKREYVAGEPIVLRVTFTNGGSVAVTIPDEAAAKRGELRFRMIDGSWRETFVGLVVPTTTEALAPSASVTYEVRLDPAAIPGLSGSGVHHLVWDGASVGASDSNRVTIVVRGA